MLRALVVLGVCSIIGFAIVGCSLFGTLKPIGGNDMGSQPDMPVCTTQCPDMAVECRDDSTCPASAPVCAASKCTACGGSSTACMQYHATSTPPTPLCGPLGACVQCLSKDDCAPTNQTCNLVSGPTMNMCGRCSIHSDCTTGVCKNDGSCAVQTEVAYVNNGSGCSDLMHTSTPSAPYCKIGDVLTLSPTLKYIVVAPSATSYDAVSLNATTAAIGPVTIIGPGHRATLTAKIAPTAGPAVSVATSGSDATVNIDGLELIGAGGGAPASAAKCQVITSGAASLSIANSYLHGSGVFGVDANACKLTLDGNVIGPSNTGGGVSATGGTFTISNNLIVGNGTAGPGVLLAGNFSSTLWWFNTVADNLRTGSQPAAFNCGGVLSGAPQIQASIVWGNTKDGAGASIGSGCGFSYSDVDDTSTPAGSGNFKMDPMLSTGTPPTTGYRLSAGSPCENKVTTATGLSGGTLPSHDVDGVTRPRSTGGYDIGASQVP